MNATTVKPTARSSTNRLVVLGFFAVTGFWDASSIIPEARMLSIEWILLYRILLAVFLGAFLFNKDRERPSLTPARELVLHALAATATLLPFALGAAPERLSSATGVAAVLALCGLLGLTAAILFSVALSSWRRIVGASRYGRVGEVLFAVLFMGVMCGKGWLASHGIEGPAMLMRPAAQVLAARGERAGLAGAGQMPGYRGPARGHARGAAVGGPAGSC